MPKLKKGLTDAFLRTVPKAQKGKRTDYTDSDTGLVLRVNDRGRKFWRLRYRVHGAGGISELGNELKGATRVIPLGEFPDLGLAAAREKASEYWTLAREGKDPAEIKREKALDRRELQALTFKVVAESYLDQAELGRKVGRKGAISTEILERRRLDLKKVIFPVLGDRPIGEITTQELVAFFDEVDRDPRTKKFPSRVDRMLNAVRGVFYFAYHVRHYIHDNPADVISARVEIVPRDRVLSDAEVRALWKATDKAGWKVGEKSEPTNFGSIVRLLLLTGQRRGEVAGMLWRDVDLDTATWTLPAAKNKSRRVHQIPLSGSALEIINGQDKGKAADRVLPGRDGAPMGGWTQLKARLDEKMLATMRKDDPEAELPHWTPHDLRRTVATRLAELKVPLITTQLLLNHQADKLMGITSTYNQHRYEGEIRDAVEQWAKELRFIVSGLKVVEKTA